MIAYRSVVRDVILSPSAKRNLFHTAIHAALLFAALGSFLLAPSNTEACQCARYRSQLLSPNQGVPTDSVLRVLVRDVQTNPCPADGGDLCLNGITLTCWSQDTGPGGTCQGE
jgi:hypothetical protein